MTCPQVEFRDPAKAIKLAQDAVSLEPEQWEYWNTLGVARYRGRQWQESLLALERSCTLSKGGNAFDFFFMAMAHHQLGHKEQAEAIYAKAVRDSESGAALIEPILHLRQEAEALLGKKSEPVAKGSEKTHE